MTTALRDLDRAKTGRVLYQRLRPGPGLPPERVIANQRARLCGAMIELVTERGYSRVTVRELSRLAGVSTKTFYACFANIESCFASTHARIIRDMFEPLSNPSDDGDECLRRRIDAIFARISRDEKAARLVLVETPSSGPAADESARYGSRVLRQVIQNEFAAPPCSVSIPPALAQGIGAAVSRIARTQLLISRPSDAATVSAGFADWLLALRSEHLGRLGRGIETLEVPSPDVGSRPPSGLADDRSLLLAAVTKLSMSGGYAGLTIPAIRQAAGVSRRSFDDNFGGVDDCFLAAVENRVDGAIERAAKEAATAPNWERATVRMISSLCCQVARDPVLARLALVEILAPGRPGLELRENVVSRCAALLRETAPPSGRPTELGAEASVAAIVSAAAAEAVAGRRQRIGATAPSMAFMGLAPAIGPAAAERAILAELSAVWTHSGQKTSSSCP